MSDDQPVVVRLQPPLWCALCHGDRVVIRLATHEVDGTSVCARHLSAALAGAREKRRAQ